MLCLDLSREAVALYTRVLIVAFFYFFTVVEQSERDYNGGKRICGGGSTCGSEYNVM